mmetsp:Transcript_74073/g.239495  ORF Transcript_74073/g.239495 Transcript_74073/m.239495 type:complete len:220 (-) Transcript_74073:10-669(-)
MHEVQHCRATPVVAAVVDLVAVAQPAQCLDVRDVRMRGEGVPEEEHRLRVARHDHRADLLVASQRTADRRADGLQTQLPQHRACRAGAREIKILQHLQVHLHELPHHLLHVVVGDQGNRRNRHGGIHVGGLLQEQILKLVRRGHLRHGAGPAVHHGGPLTHTWRTQDRRTRTWRADRDPLNLLRRLLRTESATHGAGRRGKNPAEMHSMARGGLSRQSV